MQLIHDLRSGFTNLYSQFDVSQRLYTITLLLLVGSLFCWQLLGTKVTQGLLVLFLIFWTIAILYDFVRFYKKAWGTVLGKALLILTFSLCANFAVVLSSQVVNDIAGVDPSKFPHTVVLLSFLTIPVFITAGLGILSVVMFVALPVFMMHTLEGGKAITLFFPGLVAAETIPYPRATRLIQVISIAMFCITAFSWAEKSSKSYEGFVADTARSFLYQFEMYSKSPCNLTGSGRVGFLGDGKVLVGSKSESAITFRVEACNEGR